MRIGSILRWSAVVLLAVAVAVVAAAYLISERKLRAVYSVPASRVGVPHADLGAIIAFLLRTPPVDREMPASTFGPIGRALLAIGRLNILVAPKTHHARRGVEVRAEASVDYGRYLADISGCHGCHGHGLSGGKVAGPPGLPPAANLTPTGLSAWTDTDFMRAMRDGIRPDGRQLDEFMPWRQYRAMTDAELRALWMYLQSVPPKATGNK